MTSAPRVERVDDLVVDSQGLDPPTEKWLQAAREAADTDGIRENAYAERLQMCISCCTLMCMFPMVPNMYRVSHSRYVSERVSPSYSTTGIGPFYKNMESLPVAPVPPKSLPRHSRGTPEQLPSSFRASQASYYNHLAARYDVASELVSLYEADVAAKDAKIVRLQRQLACREAKKKKKVGIL